jgi:hypothetical protein
VARTTSREGAESVVASAKSAPETAPPDRTFVKIMGKMVVELA